MSTYTAPDTGSGFHTHSGQKRSVDFLFVILLLLSLVIVAVLMILLGTGVYQRVLTSMSQNYDARTCSAYLLQKVRQGNEAGAVRVGQMPGQTPTGDIAIALSQESDVSGAGTGNALVITEMINGEFYATYLYAYDGQLTELYARTANVENGSVSASSGTPILPLEDITFTAVSDRAILAEATLTEGVSDRFLIHILPDILDREGGQP